MPGVRQSHSSTSIFAAGGGLAELDPNPAAPKYSIAFWHNPYGALDSTDGSHIIQVLPITPEGQ